MVWPLCLPETHTTILERSQKATCCRRRLVTSPPQHVCQTAGDAAEHVSLEALIFFFLNPFPFPSWCLSAALPFTGGRIDFLSITLQPAQPSTFFHRLRLIHIQCRFSESSAQHLCEKENRFMFLSASNQKIRGGLHCGALAFYLFFFCHLKRV